MAGMDAAPGSDLTVARLGAVSFLNTRPLVDGLDHDRRVQLRYAVPSALPGLLGEGLVDAALVPVIDLARRAGEWERVSDACIGSDGRTLTVRVFSKVPPERMEVLHVDPDSHTSVALARLLWSHVYGRPLRLEPIAAAERLRDCEAVLLIGDKVVTTPMPWFDHHVDLGDAWNKWTGLPFVFAVWARRTERRGDAATWRHGEMKPDAVTRGRGNGASAGVAPGCGDVGCECRPRSELQSEPQCLPQSLSASEGLSEPEAQAREQSRRGDAVKRGPGSFDDDPIARILEAARDRGVLRAAEIGAEYGPQRGWPRELAVEYLTRVLMFKLTPEALAGMDRYFELLAEAGLLSRMDRSAVTR